MARKRKTKHTGPHIFWRNGRAQEGLFVDPGYNPVSIMQEKPTERWKGESAFLEVADAALLLEATQVLEQRDRVNSTPGLHAIVATFLLTGGPKSEVLGLDVDDASFDRGLVYFRPNAHRGLMTETSVRTVPLYEWVEVSRFQVQKEMGHGGAQLVDRMYGHAQRTPYRSEVVEYRVARHREELGGRLRALEAVSA